MCEGWTLLYWCGDDHYEGATDFIRGSCCLVTDILRHDGIRRGAEARGHDAYSIFEGGLWLELLHDYMKSMKTIGAQCTGPMYVL